MARPLPRPVRRLLARCTSFPRSLGRKAAGCAASAWNYLGLLGLALTRILTWSFWKPLLLFTFPVRWLYTKLLRRPLSFISRQLWRFVSWLMIDVLLAAAHAAHMFTGLVLSDVLHVAKASFDWIRKRVRWWWPILTRNLHWQAARASKYPLRVNRLAIAILMLLVIIVLGLIPQGQTADDQGQSSESVSSENPSDGLIEPAVQRSIERAVSVQAAQDSSGSNLVFKMPTLKTSNLNEQSSNEPQTPQTDKESRDKLIAIAANKKNIGAVDSSSSGRAVLTFSSRQQGNDDIFVLVPGRDIPLRLTSHPSADRDPAWNPDGTRLAFSSRRGGHWDIYVLELATNKLVRLTNDDAFDGGPTWSPDGLWLAYESYQYGNLDLFVLDSQGNEAPTRLTTHVAHDFSPAWSPDGSHIAFTSWRDGQPDIHLLSLDADSDESAVNLTMTPDVFEDHPDFDPSGEMLSYAAQQDGYTLVYTAPVEQSRLVAEPNLIGRGSHPSWSPSGDGLAYIHNDQEQSYIVSSALDAWNSMPQAFTANAPLEDLTWEQAQISPDYERLIHPQGLSQLYLEEQNPLKEEGPPGWIMPIDVDAPSSYLSDRVDQSFTALRSQVEKMAGWDFLASLDNMFVPLTRRPSFGESFYSWNKAGRAFDIDSRLALSLDPQIEVVREDIGPDTYWRLYLRAVKQDGSQGEPLRQKPWDFSARFGGDPSYYDQGGKIKEHMPTGYYVDFTALAADYGWERVPARQDWRTFFQAIHYGHFEKRQGLSWEEAMLELYTKDELAEVLDDS